MKRPEAHGDVIAAVETALAKLPRTSADRIRVTFLDPDTIALAGEVGTLAEKEELGRRAAEAAPGFKVDNSLTVAVNRPADDTTLASRAAELLVRERIPGIGVEVRQGVAILCGAALSVADVEHARRVVGQVPGIADVRTDHVDVATEQVTETVGALVPPGKPGMPPAPDSEIVADLDEAAIVNAIQARLAEQLPPGRAEEITVQARHRTVFLKGFVRTAQERARAEEIARSVPGSSRIVNLLVSQDGSAGRDERIEAAIRHRLGRLDDHASPVDIKVFCQKDEIFLFGQADFPEQVDQAIALAREVVGPHVPIWNEVVLTSRHFRPGTGPGHSVEKASRQQRS